MHASTAPTTRTARPRTARPRTATIAGPVRPRRPRLLVAALTVPLLGLAGCGGSTSSPATSSEGSPAAVSGTPASASSAAPATFPVTVTAGNGQVRLETRPNAIVSLSPSLTEMLYAVGAGGQVKAVDDQSSYPEQAPRTKLSGFQPNAEAVAGYDPDLVVLSRDSNGLVAALAKLKIPFLVLPAPTTLEEGFAQELTIGTATGHLDEAKASIERTKQRIDAAVASVPNAAQPLKVYHEVDPTYYSVTSKTFIGSLYARFGLTNIADTAPKATGDYPQLSAEYVVSSAPDVIVLADGMCCGQTVAAVSARPAFSSVPAVTKKRVVAINDDVASRWGPRVADFAEALAAVLRE